MGSSAGATSSAWRGARARPPSALPRMPSSTGRLRGGEAPSPGPSSSTPGMAEAHNISARAVAAGRRTSGRLVQRALEIRPIWRPAEQSRFQMHEGSRFGRRRRSFAARRSPAARVDGPRNSERLLQAPAGNPIGRRLAQGSRVRSAQRGRGPGLRLFEARRHRDDGRHLVLRRRESPEIAGSSMRPLRIDGFPRPHGRERGKQASRGRRGAAGQDGSGDERIALRPPPRAASPGGRAERGTPGKLADRSKLPGRGERVPPQDDRNDASSGEVDDYMDLSGTVRSTRGHPRVAVSNPTTRDIPTSRRGGPPQSVTRAIPS